MNRLVGCAILAVALLSGACTGADGKDAAPCTVQTTDAGSRIVCGDGTSTTISGTQGPAGEAGISCTIKNLPAGGAAVVCTDGQIFVLQNAVGSLDGSTCTVGITQGGAHVVRCPDGTSVVLQDGQDGKPGAAGVSPAPCSYEITAEGTLLSCPGTAGTVTITSGAPGANAPFKVFLTYGPLDGTTSTDAAFFFDCTALTCAYQCRLDDGDWGACTSPKAFSGLSVQQHTLAIEAVPGPDAGFAPLPDGAVETASYSYTWTIASADAATGADASDAATGADASDAATTSDETGSPDAADTDAADAGNE